MDSDQPAGIPLILGMILSSNITAAGYADDCYALVQDAAVEVEPRFADFAHCVLLSGAWFTSQGGATQRSSRIIPAKQYVQDTLGMPKRRSCTIDQEAAVSMINGAPVILEGHIGMSLTVIGVPRFLIMIAHALNRHGHLSVHLDTILRNIKGLEEGDGKVFVMDSDGGFADSPIQKAA